MSRENHIEVKEGPWGGFYVDVEELLAHPRVAEVIAEAVSAGIAAVAESDTTDDGGETGEGDGGTDGGDPPTE